MQTISVVFDKIRKGHDGVADTSCYTHVGGFLAQFGEQLLQVVVAFYSVPGKGQYVHAAIEELDGKLISERRPPPKFRDTHGKPIRSDFQRSAIPVSSVLDWLKSG